MSLHDTSRPNSRAIQAKQGAWDSDRARFFEASPNAYLVLDRRLHIVAANHAYLLATGRELADIVGRWALEAFPTDPETERQAIASFERVIATGQPDTMALLRFDIPRPESDGGGFEKRFWSLIHSPVVDEDGEVAFIVQHALDVTELERLREEAAAPPGGQPSGLKPAHAGIFDRANSVHRANLDLKAESERLRLLFQNAPGSICALSGPDHVFEFANDAYLRLIGGRNPIGKPVREALPEIAGQGFLELLNTVYATGEPFVGTAVPAELNSGPEGATERRLLDFVFQPIRSAADEVIGIFVQGQDATERVRAEEEARAHARRQDFRLAVAERLRDLAEPSEMMQAATDLLMEQLDVAQVGFAEVENDGEHIRVARNSNDGRVPSVVGRWRMDDFGPAFVREMKAGETIAIPDVRVDRRTCAPEVVAAYSGIATRAILDVPLVQHGRMVAMLFIHHPEPRAWKGDEVALVEETCERLWAAVERARAEVALTESEARLRTALAVARLGTFEWDLATDAVVLDARSREIFGFAAGEGLTAQDVFDRIHPDDLPSVYADAVASGEALARLDREYRIIRPDGAVRTVNSLSDALPGGNGQAARLMGVFADVTERKAAEQALRESEQRYRTLFEAVDAGFCVVELKLDENGGPVDHFFVEVNPAFERHTGEAGAAGRWASEVAPGIEQRWHDTYARVASTGEAVRFEAPAGPLGRWFDVHAFRVGAPEQYRVAVLFNDITERKAAEKRLRDLADTLEHQVAERTTELLESQRRFQGIFDSAFQFMALLSPDGTVVEVNQAALAWSQIEASDMIGKPFWRAAPMRDNPVLQEAVESGVRRAAAGETVRAEHELRGAGEVRATVDFSLKPVPDEHGEPAWLVAEGRDITDLKAAQEALRQSQKLESMGQLTGGVAHDVNNLLTPIMGSLDLLQRKGLGGEREQRLIAGALQSTDRVRVLVQRLLAFARRQPLQPKPVDVDALITGMADLVRSTSGPQTKVTVDIAQDLPAAVADPNQLEMAILNLSVNARDAMPDGGRLTISAHAEDIAGNQRLGLVAGRYVRLSVADTGSGMDEATVKRAIEPFFSTKGIGKGTGLGLSMVHGLAAQLGGALSIASKRGLGTTVDLWLPATDQTVQRPAPLQAEAVRPAAGAALLVDDEELVRASTADMLADLGYVVTEAGSAEQALQLIADGLTPDIVITDHLMPGLSGTEFGREVARRLPNVRVLVISGYAEVEGVAPDLPRLVKPFQLSDLAGKLAEL